MKSRRIGILACLATVGALTMASAPGQAVTAISGTGVGQATFGPCPTGSDKLVLTANFDTLTAMWTFTLTDANSIATDPLVCGFVTADLYTSFAFSHTGGGCAIGTVLGIFFCLTPEPDNGGATFEYDMFGFIPFFVTGEMFVVWNFA